LLKEINVRDGWQKMVEIAGKHMEKRMERGSFILWIIMRCVFTFDRETEKGRSYRASYTVETAILVPMILFFIVGSINLSFQLYKQAGKAAEIREEITEYNPVETVRKKAVWGELAEQVKGNK